MVESVYNKYLDYMMSGVEDIAGQKGHYTFIEKWVHIERFLQYQSISVSKDSMQK